MSVGMSAYVFMCIHVVVFLCVLVCNKNSVALLFHNVRLLEANMIDKRREFYFFLFKTFIEMKKLMNGESSFLFLLPKENVSIHINCVLHVEHIEDYSGVWSHIVLRIRNQMNFFINLLINIRINVVNCWFTEIMIPIN